MRSDADDEGRRGDGFEPALPSLRKGPKGVWDDEDVEDEDVKESWEDEDPKKPKDSWDDEDAEDDDVKESWEDDEEPKQAPKQEPKEEKPVAKPAGKAAGKKMKQPEAAKATQVADQVLADPVTEKLRQQRLVEEADYKSTAELFAKKGDEQSLENFIPKSESDFLEYAELLSHKIRPYEKSFHYIGLLKSVIRLSMTSLKAADAKDIASSATALANEKLKAEKEANVGKKKQGGKKKQLLVDRPDDDIATGHYDDVDDDDFM